MVKLFLMLGCINGCLAVALGAFGAHGLKGSIDESLMSAYQTGVQYQMFHAAALLFVGLLAERMQASALLTSAGWAFAAGIVLFSGSLYLMAVTGARFLGAITPLGGVSFIIGWVLFLIYALRA